jgi:antitoxin component YwqK of YwqJK toxin-antitoxin module
MKTSCRNNKFDGLFEAWYEDGKPQISGSYVNDMRDGIWKFFLKDGKVKYVINYKMGIAEESQMDKDAENFFNRIEVNKGAIPDPEKTGTIR